MVAYESQSDADFGFEITEQGAPGSIPVGKWGMRIFYVEGEGQAKYLDRSAELERFARRAQKAYSLDKEDLSHAIRTVVF
jgi:hypothetical protein